MLPTRAVRLLCLISPLLVSCAESSRDAAPRRPPDPSAATAPGYLAPWGSLAPRLQATGDGALLLSWLQRRPEGDAAALRFALLEAGSWGEPRTVVERGDLFVNWADTPGVVRDGSGRLWAWWLQMAGEGTYAYHVVVAFSGDDGDTWSEPVRLHDDDRPVEHGFVSMAAGEEGIAAVWLDGRQTGEGGEGAMALRFRTMGPGSIGGSDELLDSRVCDCCSTDLVADGRGGYVAVYRDRSPAEVRDISVVRKPGLLPWAPPGPLSRDGWTLRGCPVNGPALDAAAGWYVAAWFTAQGGEPRVMASYSEDGGETWGSSVRVDGGSPLGRVDILALPDQSARVIWMEGTQGSAQIRMRSLSPQGVAGEARVVARTGGMRASGFPRLARFGEHLWLAWTRTGERGTRVEVAAVESLEHGR